MGSRLRVLHGSYTCGWGAFVHPVPCSEELLGLGLGCAFGGCGGFGVNGEKRHDVLEGFAYLSSEPVGVLE